MGQVARLPHPPLTVGTPAGAGRRRPPRRRARPGGEAGDACFDLGAVGVGGGLSGGSVAFQAVGATGYAVLQSPLLPAGLLAGVLGLDAVQSAIRFHVLVNGALDESAHLATAALALIAAVSLPTLRRRQTVAVSALLASVSIDVDHVPLYAWVTHNAASGRPHSHSLVTIAALLAASSALPRRRQVLAGAGLGVGLHFLRDVGTGPGLPLWWPVTAAAVRVPYPAYLAVLVALVAAATARRLREQARRPAAVGSTAR